MPRYIDPMLKDALRRPNPNVYFGVEIIQPVSQQILRRATDQWLNSPTPLVSLTPASSFGTQADGGVCLAQTVGPLCTFGGTAGTPVDISGTQHNTTRLKAMGWKVASSFDRGVLRSFAASMKRKVGDGTHWYASALELQIFKVTQFPGTFRVTSSGSATPFINYTFTPLLNPPPQLSVQDQINQGFVLTNQTGTVTWDITSYQVLVDGAAQSTPSKTQDGDLPVLYFCVSAVDFGYLTDHHEWQVDNSTSQTVGGVGNFAQRWWSRATASADDIRSQWTETIFNVTNNFSLAVETYVKTGTAVYVINLPVLPAPPNVGRIVWDQSVPAGCSTSLNYSKTSATGPWTAVTNSQIITDYQQQYWLQLTLNANASQRATPEVRALGIQFSNEVDFSYEAKPQFSDKSIDLPFCAGKIGQLNFTFLKTGQRDYLDSVTNLITGLNSLVTTGVTGLEMNLWLKSNHQQIGRSKWLLMERQAVTDRVPSAIAEQFLTYSYLQKLQKKIPLQVESLFTTHTVRAGTIPNNTTAFQIFVDAGTPLQQTPYAGKNYYFRVASSSVLPAGFTQAIDGSSGTSLLLFNNGLPAVMNDGDKIEVHSGLFGTTPLTYTNADPATVWLDLLTNQLGIPADRIGLAGLPNNGYPPTVTQRAPGDATTQGKLLVTNYITSPEQGDKFIDQISFIMGGATVEIAGQIVFVQIYPTTSPIGHVTVPLPAPQFSFDHRDFKSLSVQTSLQKRIVLCSCDYGVNQTSADPSSIPTLTTTYVDVDALNYLQIQDIQQFGNGVIDQDTAKWVYNTNDSGLYLASLLCRQIVLAFSTGQHIFQFETVDQYPELSIGDTVNISTDQYVDYDPSTGNIIAGWVSYQVVLISVGDGGKKFQGMLPGLNGYSKNLRGGNQGNIGGTNTQGITCPNITVVTEFENSGGIVSLQAVVNWSVPTSPYYSHMEVQVQAVGNTAATHYLGAIPPGRVVIHANTQYTFTPICVTTAGVRTTGNAITVNASSQGVVTTPISIGKTPSEIHAVFGSYTATANPGTTATSYNTWTGSNPTTVTTVASFAWVSSPSPAVITLTTNPVAASGTYVINYTMASSGPGTGQVRCLVEYSINGGSWTTYGYIPVQSTPYSSGSTTIAVALGAGTVAGATSVAFRLTAQAYQTSAIQTVTNTVTGISPGVQWAYTTAGTVYNRVGVQHISAVAGTPHAYMLPTSSGATDTTAAAGEIQMVTLGTGQTAFQAHDGNAFASFTRYAISAITADTVITVASASPPTLLAGAPTISVYAGEKWCIEMDAIWTQAAASFGIFLDLTVGTATFTTHVGIAEAFYQGGTTANPQSGPYFAAFIAPTAPGGYVRQILYITVNTSGTIGWGAGYQSVANQPTLKAGSIIRAWRVG